jgi:hypothetical protein
MPIGGDARFWRWGQCGWQKTLLPRQLRKFHVVL